MEDPPYQELLRPVPTGGTIVTFKDRNPDRQRRILESVIRSQTGRSAAVATSSLEGIGAGVDVHSEAYIIGDTGIAAIPPSLNTQEGITSLANILNAETEVEEARPEFYLYAIQGAKYSDTAAHTWGVEAVGALTSAATGRGIKVCILDTGFALNHPDFVGRSITAQSFVANETADDGNGHGTHCTGTAAGPAGGAGLPRYGVAHEADIFIGKVLNNAGFGVEREILSGIVWALQQRCEVISMSLGAPVQRGGVHSAAYERLGQQALAQGSLIVAAAGNDSTRQFGFIAPVSLPANSPSFMAVAAIDPSEAMAPFSNGGINPNGGEVDIAGPGVSVFSSYPLPRGHRAISGTSMACPHVAGVAALFAGTDQALRGAALRNALVANAAPLSHPARDVGAGLVRAPQSPAPPQPPGVA